MELRMKIIYIGIGVVIGYLLAILLMPYHLILDIGQHEYIKLLILCLTPLALILGLMTYVFNYTKAEKDNKDKISEKFMNQAIVTIERAYAILTTDGKSTDPPLALSNNWETSARLIESYKTIKNKVSSINHIDVLSEHEEYWRQKFYLALRSEQMQSPEYFAKSRKARLHDNDIQNLNPVALAVIYNFSECRKDYNDPLIKVDEAKMLAYGTIIARNSGLLTYIKQFPPLDEQIIEYQKLDPTSFTRFVHNQLTKKSR
jgi:hypothetical protein